MEDVIEFDCNFENLNVTKSDIVRALPHCKTRVVNVSFNRSLLTINFLLAATTAEEVKQWIKAYEELTLCSYSVRSTQKCTGRYVLFKQRLNCKRNTRCRRIYEPDVRNRTRNTNCPSLMEFTLRAVKARYKGKNKALAPDRLMPCVVKLVVTHNHGTNSPDALKFRDVSDEVKEKLITLYQNGHTAGTALETLKMEIRQNFENYEEKLADRKYCPSYNYCYHLYIREFKKMCLPTNLEKNSNDFVAQRLRQYNEETKEDSARAVFSDDSTYVICICPPLCRRIHKILKSSSDMVLMDSSGTLDRDGSRIFILFTYSECGALPLGVIIISSKSASLLNLGFELLKEMLDENLFSGSINGPSIFLINDSSVEQVAAKAAWTNSHCLLHIFFVLQNVWRWLLTSQNGIEQEDRYRIFKDFKSILYAETIKECHMQYKRAVQNAKEYTKFVKYLEQYWARKELWTLSYRHNLIKDHNTNNYSEAMMWLLKEKIFERTKTFNLIQMVDFLLTKFVQHYETRIMDAAHNQLSKNLYGTVIKMPSEGLIERIQILTDKIYLVPSEKEDNFFYIVNSEALICTCSHGNTKICKHINWICFIVDHPQCFKAIDSLDVRKKFYEIASGYEPPLAWLTENSVPSGRCKEEIDAAENEIIVYRIEDTNSNFKCEETRKEGEEIVDDICALLKQMVEKSPHEMVHGLKIMKENILKLDTTTAFAEACASFGSEFCTNNESSNITIESTAASR